MRRFLRITWAAICEFGLFTFGVVIFYWINHQVVINGNQDLVPIEIATTILAMLAGASFYSAYTVTKILSFGFEKGVWPRSLILAAPLAGHTMATGQLYVGVVVIAISFSFYITCLSESIYPRAYKLEEN